MPILRTDIERALDELSSQEEGMRFQGLAVVLGKMRWPELIARQRKKDFGLDAYAPASLSPDGIGKGLAASITPTLKKVSDDADTAKKNFNDLQVLLFVTSAKVGNADRKRWEETIQAEQGLELHILEREEIITLMLMPENASLRASFLHLTIDSDSQVAVLIDKTRRAANAVTQTWIRKTKGRPLIDLTAAQLGPNGADSNDVWTLAQIGQALSQGSRFILEGPAGRGKTTTLIQLAQLLHSTGTPFIVELPAWTASSRGILEYIAGMPAFQAEGLTVADLARAQQTEPFFFLLNGWNEISESNSIQADDALRELERDFPSAGIIVATRTHHLVPPLPGALRLRLLRLRRMQRAAYLNTRLGAKAPELRARIDADQSLDELTRTPFILSEVASLFEVNAEIPSTKIGILDQVLRLQERRDEHRNPLQVTPIFGRQLDYLTALATEMTRRGAVELPEADARTFVSAIARQLADLGQIDVVGAPAILATLTAHHVLERIDYPQTAFQFEHQQLQEFCAALHLRAQLLELPDDDHEATFRFTSAYVNDPAWAEPLRMIAETFAVQTGNDNTDKLNKRVGGKLVKMALAVDLVFAGELAQLCGPAIWNDLRIEIGERFRATYAIRDGSYRHYALAAMLATGADDFRDIIVPLLSGQDQQIRLRTYRLWPDIQVSSLGLDWREQVREWSDEARTDFVSELLHHRVDEKVSAFAAEDASIKVKDAAVSGLMWTGSDDLLTRALESLDAQAFEDIARKNSDQMPAALRPKTIAAMLSFIETSTDHAARLRTALDLVELGEPGLDSVVKDAMAALPDSDMSNLSSQYIEPALKYLRHVDPAWTSEWVATHIAEGLPYGHEYWLPFVTTISDCLVEKYLRRLETEDFKNRHVDGVIAVIASQADANLVARVFAKLREMRQKVDADPYGQHEYEWHITNQLKAVFHNVLDDVAATGILSSIETGNTLDIIVVSDLLSRIDRSDVEPLCITDDDLKARLRAYLKDNIDIVLKRDDFNGEEKANLASSIAQVGSPEDMEELARLIHSDIERVRRGRAAREAGDRGPLGNGGIMTCARRHIAAVLYLDADAAEKVLVDLLHEPEYRTEVAAAMARAYLPKQEFSLHRTFRYDLMWAAREGRALPANDLRRTRFAVTLNTEIKLLRDQHLNGKTIYGLKELAKELAAVDGRGSAAAVLDVISMPGQWDHHIRLDAVERLLMAGVILPYATVLALLDSIFERMEKWMQDSDRHLLLRILALCPFVDNHVAGIAKIREVLNKWQFRGYEISDLVTALGESRSEAAVDLLYEIASDTRTFEQCEVNFIKAFATLDTPRAREILLGFVDPEIDGIVFTRRPERDDEIAQRIAELARHWPQVATLLQDLCKRELPELNREILSKVMLRLGTPAALTANLNLIDDTKHPPVPRGIWEQLESAFIERQPYKQELNMFTEHPRVSNEQRLQLFRMANEDEKRQKSAFMLLGRIEEIRLEYGRPNGEPRHPDFASGQLWPPKES